MNAIQIKYKNKIIDIDNIPSSWNELSDIQLKYIAKNWEQWKVASIKGVSLLKYKCALFLKLVPQLKYSLLKKILPKIEDEKLYELTELTNFVFEKNDFTKCPVQSIGSLFKLYPPADKLNGIVGFEFMFADDNYISYHKYNKPEYLDKLIASIYRPKKIFSAERVQFNKNKIEKYARSASKLSNAKKQLILLWYIGCRNHIVAKNKHIFPGDTDNESQSGSFLSLILALSNGSFGTFDQTGNTSLHLLFMDIKEAAARIKPKKKK
jgi:hypothetical protein